jgi:tRNA threonylcarbamoyladenosine biosynthesis protein TsaB
MHAPAAPGDVRILAADTALGACSVALLGDGRVPVHRWQAMPRGHAEALAPMVRAVLAEAGVAARDLDRLAVTTGPGTFTGQRVGLAFMRGLRLALDRPLVGVTTLEAMAAAAVHEAGAFPVGVLHEARRGEVYGALYAGRAPILPVQVQPFEAMLEAFAREADSRAWGSLAFAGTGTEAGAAWWSGHGRQAHATGVRQPDARFVAELGLYAAVPEGVVRPLYLRPPDAKLPARRPWGDLSLRLAGPGDAGLVAALQAATMTTPWEASFFSGLLESPAGLALVAEIDGTAVGFALARVVADEAEILGIGILPVHRRKGMGVQLLREAARRTALRGARTLFLEVDAGNAPARALYDRVDFRAVGTRKGYYAGEGGGDALILRAVLGAAGLGNSPDLV